MNNWIAEEMARAKIRQKQQARVSHNPQKVWIYCGRSSSPEAFYNFEDARKVQDEDNRMTLDEIIAEFGQDAVSGSEEEGNFSIDDGGSITLVEIQ